MSRPSPAQDVCLITGAARGIGAATARVAARRGYGVCINYATSDAEAAALVAEIAAAGGKAMAHRADVSREDEVAAMFAAVDRTLGPITALVNNAAVPGERLDLLATDAAAFRRILDVNLVGAFLCTKEAVARMARSRGGSGGAIVNVSSTATKTGGYRLTPYVSSKAGVEGLTRALSAELASEGIRINAVSPGIVATERLAGADPQWRERAAASIPLGRLGDPQEIAHAIVWLLSPEASYITGSILDASGGR